MSQNMYENDFLDFLLTMDSTSPFAILKQLNNFVGRYFPLNLTGLFLSEDLSFNGIVFSKSERTNNKVLYIKEDVLDVLKKENRPVMESNKEVFKNKADFGSLLKDGYSLLLPLQETNDFIGVLYFCFSYPIDLREDLAKKFRFITKYVYLLVKNKYYFDKVEQRLAELLTLQTVSDFVNSTLDFEKLLDITLDAIVGLIGLRTCSITIFTDKLFNDIYTRKQKSLVNTVQSSQEIEIDLTKGIYGCLSKNRTSISGISEVNDEIIRLLPSLTLSKGKKVQYIILPITRGDDLFGSINIFDPTLVHLNNIENHFLESFTNQFSIALQNANLYRKQEEMAQKDGLTSLYNHAYFQNRLDLLIKENAMKPLSLIIMDIDDFKKVNDHYGHLTGDKVLKELSSLLLKSTRDGDLVARYGGEEFAILMPCTRNEDAYKLALRLNKKIQDNLILIDDGEPLSVTVSIGVAEYKEEWTKEEFIDKVDQLLYQAKANGKNRVETAL